MTNSQVSESKHNEVKQNNHKKHRANSSDKNSNAKIWAGFYKKTLKERLDQL